MADVHREYTVIIEDEKLADLIQLSEERDLAKNMVRALTLYYHSLKYQTDGYRLGLIPVDDKGQISFAREIIYIDVSHL